MCESVCVYMCVKSSVSRVWRLHVGACGSQLERINHSSISKTSVAFEHRCTAHVKAKRSTEWVGM